MLYNFSRYLSNNVSKRANGSMFELNVHQSNNFLSLLYVPFILEKKHKIKIHRVILYNSRNCFQDKNVWGLPRVLLADSPNLEYELLKIEIIV